MPILSCVTHLEQPHCLYGIVRVESEAVVDASRDNDEVIFVDLRAQHSVSMTSSCLEERVFNPPES